MTPVFLTSELDDLENRLRATFRAVDAASPQPSTRPVLLRMPSRRCSRDATPRAAS